MRFLVALLIVVSPLCASFSDFNDEMHHSTAEHNLQIAEKHFAQSDFESAIIYYMLAEASNCLATKKDDSVTIRAFVGSIYAEILLKKDAKGPIERLVEFLKCVELKDHTVCIKQEYPF